MQYVTALQRVGSTVDIPRWNDDDDNGHCDDDDDKDDNTVSENSLKGKDLLRFRKSCSYKCVTAVHNTAHNSSESLNSYSPDNQHTT